MKNKIILIVGILIIALGASWYIFVQIPKQIEEEFITSIPSDMKVVYGNFNVDPIAQKITIEQTKISHKNLPFIINVGITEIKRNGDEEIAFKSSKLKLDSSDTNYNFSVEELKVNTIKHKIVSEIVKKFQESPEEGFRSLNKESSKIIENVTAKNLNLMNEEDNHNIDDLNIAYIGQGTINNLILKNYEFNQETKKEKALFKKIHVIGFPLINPNEKRDILLKKIGSNEIIFDNIEISGIEYYKSKKDPIIIGDINFQKPLFGVSNNESTYFKSLGLDVNGIKIPLNKTPKEFQEIISKYHKSEFLGANIGFKFKSDHIEGNLGTDIKLGLQDLGNLSVGVALSGTPSEVYDMLSNDIDKLNQDAIFKNFISNAKLNESSIVFTELGLLDKYFSQTANERNVTKESIVSEIQQMLDMELNNSKSEKKKEAINNLKEFLLSPKELQISAIPQNPLQLQTIPGLFFMDRDQLSEIIDLKVTNIK